MAGVKWRAVIAEVTTGATLKTLLQVVAPANQRLEVLGFGVSFKGVTAADAPILVELVKQSTAGTSSALTPVKGNPSDSETLQVTARQGFSGTEPTSTDVYFTREVHPQGGSHTEWFPFGQELPVPGGGRLGLRVTAAVAVNAVAFFAGEE